MEESPRGGPAVRSCSTPLVGCLVLGFLGCTLMGALAADLPGTAVARWFDPASPFSLPRVYGAALAGAVAVALSALAGRAARRVVPVVLGSAVVLLGAPAPVPAGAVTAVVGVVLGCLVGSLALLDRLPGVPEGAPTRG